MKTAKAPPQRKGAFSRILRGFRPALPATIGAGALSFLFAAFMPLPWVQGLSWNLYLDSINPLFAPPVGNAARLVMATVIAILAALLALVVALAFMKPEVKGNRAMNQRVAARARQARAEAEADAADPLRRRRADAHPDAPAVAPISAHRDLPAEGLGPIAPPVDFDDDAPFDLSMANVVDEDDRSIGRNFDSPQDSVAGPFGRAPQPVSEIPDDGTLGSMVKRFEAGLGRRRPGATGQGTTNDDNQPAIDLGLDAALSTLQRMSNHAAG